MIFNSYVKLPEGNFGLLMHPSQASLVVPMVAGVGGVPLPLALERHLSVGFRDPQVP